MADALRTVDTAEKHIRKVTSLVELHELRAREEGGKNRVGVHDALDARELALLEAARPDTGSYRVRRTFFHGTTIITPRTPERIRGLPADFIEELLRSGAIEPA